MGDRSPARLVGEFRNLPAPVFHHPPALWKQRDSSVLLLVNALCDMELFRAEPYTVVSLLLKSCTCYRASEVALGHDARCRARSALRFGASAEPRQHVHRVPRLCIVERVKRSADRILTTHVGSLPRPKELLDMMRNMLGGRGDDAEFADQLRDAVSACVREQVDHGIDVVSDGEQGKLGFSRYIQDRLDGFETRPRPGSEGFAPEVEDFPEYYEQYFRRAMMGGAIAPATALICTGPITYTGQGQLTTDIENLKAATRGSEVDDVFMSAVAPSGVGKNDYYDSDEEYFFALADALKTEYHAIVDAGFVLQVDDPFLAELYSYSGLPADECRERGELFVAAMNRALEGIPPDRVRYHTCYGINEGPRVHDAPLKSFIDLILKVNAGAYSFEAANARHAHEYHVWESVRLPPEKVLLPGAITQGSNIVEHPALISERIVNFARIVGRERVIASADCGFSSQATYNPEVHPRIMWAKFDALVEGARLATRVLWAE